MVIYSTWWSFLLVFIMIHSKGPSAGCRFSSGWGWVVTAHALPGALVVAPGDEAGGSGNSASATAATRTSHSSDSTGDAHSFTVEVNEGTDLEPVDEQTRIDTMVRAFQRLPEPELARLGVDITGDKIESGSERATRLREAWVKRQAELKNAVDSMVKPAEFMAEIAAKLRDTQYHMSSGTTGNPPVPPMGAEAEAGVVSSLRELEGLVDDVDNARDFHTIGGWPILVGMLEPHHSTSVQAAAAWAIGTAVKNSYDYQLWALESRQSHPIQLSVKQQQQPATGDVNTKGETVGGTGADLHGQLTCLEKLVSLLYNVGTATDTGSRATAQQEDELQRRVLYAISSAIRGNTDVQEAVVAIGHDRVYPSGSTGTTAGTGTGTASIFLDYLALAASASTQGTAAGLSNNRTTTTATPTTTATTTDATGTSPAPRPVSAEIVRKVWAIVADMLEERAYIKGELAATPDLPPEALPQLLSLRLLGDNFCTAAWAERAVRALLGVWGEYQASGGGVVAAGRIVSDDLPAGGEEADDARLARRRSEAATLRASMSSLLIVVKQLLTQSPSVWESHAELVRVLQVQVLILSDLQGSADEALASSAKDILTLL